MMEYWLYAALASLCAAVVVTPFLSARRAYTVFAVLTGVAAAAALMMLSASLGGVAVLFDGAVIIDGFSLSAFIIMLVVALLAGLGVLPFAEEGVGGAFYSILAVTMLGVMSISFSGDVVQIYAAWILAAVSSYVIVGCARDRVAAEAASKYGVMGALATVMILYALLLTAFCRGSLYLGPVARPRAYPFYMTAITFLAATAIGFKIGVVPFHAWLPDVYGNARPSLVAVVASLSKLLAAVFIVKLLILPVNNYPFVAAVIMAVLAAVTMTYGNIGALTAPTPQLLLAYSAIAQAGYLLVGFTGLSKLPGIDRGAALEGIILHAAGYSLAVLAAFLVLDVLRGEELVSWVEVRGALSSSPLAAAAMGLSLATLAGVPPTAGFWGKLLMAVSVASYAPLLVFIMGVNIAISAYYYFRLLYILVKPEASAPRIRCDIRVCTALIASLAALVLGFLTPLFGSLKAYGIAG